MVNKLILIVDDAAFMRMTIKNAISKEGFTNIIEASNGKDAVATYKTSKPDMVIMDITMPDMDGLEALKEIRKIDNSAKIVMCSAMGQESMVIEAIQNGALDFIVKPFKPERVTATISKVLS